MRMSEDLSKAVMANSSSSSNRRPAFVGKLWKMVNDEENYPYIRWMPDGKSIQVVNREAFEKSVLPQYFKHANFSSFVRQLNMYGWHKVQDLSTGSMHSSDEHWQFQCPYFVKDREDLLDNIVRNRSTKQAEDIDETKDLSRVVKELDAIKNKQNIIGEDLHRLHKENELLWNEYLETKSRHDKHSQLLDRILRFMAEIYGNQPGKLLDLGNSGAIPPPKRRLLTQEGEGSPSECRDVYAHRFHNEIPEASSAKISELSYPNSPRIALSQDASSEDIISMLSPESTTSYSSNGGKTGSNGIKTPISSALIPRQNSTGINQRLGLPLRRDVFQANSNGMKTELSGTNGLNQWQNHKSPELGPRIKPEPGSTPLPLGSLVPGSGSGSGSDSGSGSNSGSNSGSGTGSGSIPKGSRNLPSPQPDASFIQDLFAGGAVDDEILNHLATRIPLVQSGLDSIDENMAAQDFSLQSLSDIFSHIASPDNGAGLSDEQYDVNDFLMPDSDIAPEAPAAE